jgi:glycosyltransferase involved in cell wall biosynthesis
MSFIPVFSVIIPVFNRVDPLQRALQAVARQSFKDFEVLVIDDGSNDDNAQKISNVVNQIDIQNIRLIRYENNINGAHARNVGIKAAIGKYICLLDSDDEWTENKLSVVHEFINQNTPKFVYHQCRTESGKVIPSDGISDGELYTHYCFVRNQRVGAPTSTITILREIALVNLFDATLTGHQDWDLCLRLEKAGVVFSFIEDVLSIRHTSKRDSVGSSISFDYSLNFFRSRSQYFTLRSASHFHWLTLLPKAVRELRVIDAFFYSKHFWFMFIFLRSQAIKDIAKGLQVVWLINRRISYVKRQIKNLNNEGDILIFGDNYYGEILNNALDKKVTCIIDSSPFRESSCGKPVLNVTRLNEKSESTIAAIILATDQHYESMTASLVKQHQKLGKKVIYF